MQEGQEPALHGSEWGDMDKGLGGLLNNRQGDRRKGSQNHGRAGALGLDMGISRRDAFERLPGARQQ